MCRGTAGRKLKAASRAEGPAAVSWTPSVPRWPQRLNSWQLARTTLPLSFIFSLRKGRIHTACSRGLQKKSETCFGTEQPINFRTATVFPPNMRRAGEVTGNPCSRSPHYVSEAFQPICQIIKCSLDPHFAYI